VAAAEPFDLVGDDAVGVGVVCVHGFTGTPYEVRFLGEAIARAGFTVHGLRLPGHGTSMADLDRTRWTDWVGAVEHAVLAMRARTREVVLVGQSLGGLLALHHAAHRKDVVAVATLAAPLWLGGLATRVATWTRGSRIRAIPKLGGSDIRDRRAKAENPCYPAIPTRALGEFVDFMTRVRGELAAITQPVLVLHAEHDHTAPIACAAEIARATRAERIRILPRSYHLIAADVERDVVAAEVVAFVRRHTSHLERDLPCAM
jgi:carboxylesterase